MAFIFRKDDAEHETGELFLPEEEGNGRALWQDALYMLTMVLILVFASFARPTENDGIVWQMIFSVKWYLVIALVLVLAVMLKKWFVKEELKGWVDSTWGLPNRYCRFCWVEYWWQAFFWDVPVIRH